MSLDLSRAWPRILVSFFILGGACASGESGTARANGTGNHHHSVVWVDSCQHLDEEATTYLLARDLVSTQGACFTIRADQVVLDGQGHTIKGKGGSGVAVVGAHGVVVKDIHLENCGPTFLMADGCEGLTVQDNLLTARLDSFSMHTGIALFNSPDATVLHNEIRGPGPGGVGIFVDCDSTYALVLENTIADGQGAGIIIVASYGSYCLNELSDLEDGYHVAVYPGDPGFNTISLDRFRRLRGHAIHVVGGFSTTLAAVDFGGPDIGPNDRAAYDVVIGEETTGTILQDIEYIGRFSIANDQLTVFDQDCGEIQFIDAVSGRGRSLTECLQLRLNEASCQGLPGFNAPARIRLFNLPPFGDPVILRDGAPCDPQECINLQLRDAGETAQFDVAHWTTYSVGEGR